jgi:hypothetical protein
VLDKEYAVSIMTTSSRGHNHIISVGFFVILNC